MVCNKGNGCGRRGRANQKLIREQQQLILLERRHGERTSIYTDSRDYEREGKRMKEKGYQSSTEREEGGQESTEVYAIFSLAGRQ